MTNSTNRFSPYTSNNMLHYDHNDLARLNAYNLEKVKKQIRYHLAKLYGVRFKKGDLYSINSFKEPGFNSNRYPTIDITDSNSIGYYVQWNNFGIVKKPTLMLNSLHFLIGERDVTDWPPISFGIKFLTDNRIYILTLGYYNVPLGQKHATYPFVPLGKVHYIDEGPEEKEILFKRLN